VKFEIIGFYWYEPSQTARTIKTLSYDIPTVDPESMLKRKETSHCHREHLGTPILHWLRSSNQRLAVRAESLPTTVMGQT
jgi:hypothetical protein